MTDTTAADAKLIAPTRRRRSATAKPLPLVALSVGFVALMQLMDNFRVFEPIVGFSAEANATSLSYLIYSDLRGADTPLFASAAATSVLTTLGVIVLLMPVLIRTWRDFNRKA